MNRQEHTVALIRARQALNLTSPRSRLPRQQHPTLIAVEYRKAIMPFLETAHELLQDEVFPHLPEVVRAASERHDAVSVVGSFEKVARQLFERVKPGAIETVARQFGKRTTDFQKQQLARQVRAALGVDLGILEPKVDRKLAAFTTQNVQLIKSIPQQYLADVEGRVSAAVRSGMRWETLKDDLVERYQVAENRAELIARDQVGKLYGEINMVRQEALGVTSYTWRTANDERVRDEHAEREGETFDWSDPPEDGHPGEAIQCRCSAEPDFSALFESLAGEAPAEDG